MISSPYAKWEPGTDRTSLLITFAAMAGTSTAPTFAFGQVAGELQCSKLFFVDPNEIIYQRGIPGVGSDFWEVAEAIKELQKREGVQRTTLIGNSSGGFAALVTGAIIGNCTVHAFNPPTFLTSPTHTHNKLLCRRMAGANPRNKRTLNLSAFLKEESVRNTESYVYYSRGEAIDRKRSVLLKGVPGLRVIPYNLLGHELARYMAKEGTISELLRASFNGNENNIETMVRKSRRKANLRMTPIFTEWWMKKIRRRIDSIRGLRNIKRHASMEPIS